MYSEFMYLFEDCCITVCHCPSHALIIQTGLWNVNKQFFRNGIRFYEICTNSFKTGYIFISANFTTIEFSSTGENIIPIDGAPNCSFDNYPCIHWV